MRKIFIGVTTGAFVDNVDAFGQNTAIEQKVTIKLHKITEKSLAVASDKFFGSRSTECFGNALQKIAADLVTALVNARTDRNANVFR